MHRGCSRSYQGCALQLRETSSMLNAKSRSAPGASRRPLPPSFSSCRERQTGVSSGGNMKRRHLREVEYTLASIFAVQKLGHRRRRHCSTERRKAQRKLSAAVPQAAPGACNQHRASEHPSSPTRMAEKSRASSTSARAAILSCRRPQPARAASPFTYAASGWSGRYGRVWGTGSGKCSSVSTSGTGGSSQPSQGAAHWISIRI